MRLSFIGNHRCVHLLVVHCLLVRNAQAERFIEAACGLAMLSTAIPR